MPRSKPRTLRHVSDGRSRDPAFLICGNHAAHCCAPIAADGIGTMNVPAKRGVGENPGDLRLEDRATSAFSRSAAPAAPTSARNRPSLGRRAEIRPESVEACSKRRATWGIPVTIAYASAKRQSSTQMCRSRPWVDKDSHRRSFVGLVVLGNVRHRTWAFTPLPRSASILTGGQRVKPFENLTGGPFIAPYMILPGPAQKRRPRRRLSLRRTSSWHLGRDASRWARPGVPQSRRRCARS